MRFESEEHKTTFDVPDRPTGRTVLAFEEEIERPGTVSMYERLWAACCRVAENWQGPVELSPAILSDSLPPADLAALKWAALAAFSWYLNWKQETTPKN